MDQDLLRQLVWTDYRLAVLFTVLIPLILLIWSLIKRSEAMVRLLMIYWRVSSLLMITVYLMIPAWSIAFITSFSARVLIPISLWFWVDLNDEISDMPSSRLKLVLTSWRWALTIYSTIGAIATIPFLSCTFTANVRENPFCKVWFEAPWQYREIFHRNSTPGLLGFIAAVGLIIYVLYLGDFLFVRLGKQGRSAFKQ